MKKYFCVLAVLALVVSTAYAGITFLSRFGPTRSTTNLTTIAAPSSSAARNCLKNLDVYSDAAYVLNVLDGGTTTYSVTLASGTTLIRAWDAEDLFCASAGAAMYINIPQGNAKVNYSGFTY